jgi:hypothetical protein
MVLPTGEVVYEDIICHRWRYAAKAKAFCVSASNCAVVKKNTGNYIMSVVDEKYAAVGGSTGFLGQPTSDEADLRICDIITMNMDLSLVTRGRCSKCMGLSRKLVSLGWEKVPGSQRVGRDVAIRCCC